MIFGLLVAAVSAFAMDTYGFVVSTQAFQTFTETDSHEVYDLISWRLVGYLSFLFILPAILIWRKKYQYPGFKRNCVVMGLCLVLMAGDVALFSKNYLSFIRNHRTVRYYANPVRPIYSMAKYSWHYISETGGKELAILDSSPKRTLVGNKPKLVILVVGESDRAANQKLNGYVRNTNPILSQRGDIISFESVQACGTETSISVPCMFSVFPRQEYSYIRGRYTENVLDILQRSNVRVLWRDNDSGCKGVCERVELDDFNFTDIQPYCNNFECYDEVLLHNIQDRIDQSDGDQLMVLHKKGNHGPAYYKRYPQQFKQFMPTCDSNEIHYCTDEQIVNTYDNIILYTDFFLDQVIKILEHNSNTYNTAMLYISDHGQSLGENGIYLHAMPYWIAPKEQIYIPFFMWTSKDFPINQQMLQAKHQNDLSHDNLFHTLLGIFDVTSSVYLAELDILHGLQTPDIQLAHQAIE